MTITSSAPAFEIEGSFDKEGGAEQLPDAHIVEKSIEDIQTVQDRVTETLHLEANSPDAILATDQALAHIAESNLDSQEVSDADKNNAMNDVVIESAIEIDHGVEASRTPVAVLELDGHGGDVDETVARLQQSHATLPSGHEAAPLMMAAIDKLGEQPVMQEVGTVEFITSEAVASSPESGVEAKNLSNESVQRDITERLMTPVEGRKGTEIIDTESGEIFKPAFELEIEDSDKQAILDTLKKRRSSIANMNALLDANNGGVPTFDKEDLLAVMSAAYMAEGEMRRGNISDVFMSPEDAKAMLDLGARLDAFSMPGVTPVGEQFGLTEAQVAQRAVDFSEQIIPEGTLLLHAAKAPMDIIGSGSLKPKFDLFVRNQSLIKDAKHSQGAHSNFVHFGEPGKVNIFYEAGTVIGIPIETVIEHTPYLQPEAMYQLRDNDKLGSVSIQEKFGRIVIPKNAELPLAIQRRMAVLADRYKQGIQKQGDSGTYNNLSFAATSQKESAASYEYPLDKAVIFADDSMADTIEGPSAQAFLAEQGVDSQWQASHISRADLHQSNGSMNVELALPPSFAEDSESIVAYGPVAQQQVSFKEDQLQRVVDIRKDGYVSKYAEFNQRQEAARAEAYRVQQAQRVEAEMQSLGMNAEQYEQHLQTLRDEYLRTNGPLVF